MPLVPIHTCSPFLSGFAKTIVRWHSCSILCVGQLFTTLNVGTSLHKYISKPCHVRKWIISLILCICNKAIFLLKIVSGHSITLNVFTCKNKLPDFQIKCLLGEQHRDLHFHTQIMGFPFPPSRPWVSTGTLEFLNYTMWFKTALQ